MSQHEALSRELEGVVAEGGLPLDLFRKVVDAIVKVAAAATTVYEDEVAIFMPTTDGSTFRFAAPWPLYEDGSTFPAKGSITQKVFAGTAPLVNNNVKVQKPLSIYERAKISDRNPRPIQKMLATPMHDGSHKVGVLQVSRRGLAVREAGPDFGEKETAALARIARTAASFLRRTVPDDF